MIIKKTTHFTVLLLLSMVVHQNIRAMELVAAGAALFGLYNMRRANRLEEQLTDKNKSLKQLKEQFHQASETEKGQLALRLTLENKCLQKDKEITSLLNQHMHRLLFRKNEKEIVDMLNERPNIDILPLEKERGNTLLHRSIIHSLPELSETLLKLEKSKNIVNHKNNQGKTPLYLLVKSPYTNPAIAKSLLQAGGNPNILCENELPLKRALLKTNPSNRRDIVSLLILHTEKPCYIWQFEQNPQTKRMMLENVQDFVLHELKKENEAGGDGCSICFEKLDATQKRLCMHICKNFFHKECLDKWQHDDCPLCRKKKEARTIEIFTPTISVKIKDSMGKAWNIITRNAHA